MNRAIPEIIRRRTDRLGRGRLGRDGGLDDLGARRGAALFRVGAPNEGGRDLELLIVLPIFDSFYRG
jgi:hypothetical protein